MVAGKIKNEYGVQKQEALSQIWASDKFSFPLQIATIALTEPENMGEVLQVFRHDVAELVTEGPVVLKDPYDGSDVPKKLPAFPYIVSNLPFVQFEDIEETNPHIYNINGFIQEMTGTKSPLTKKSDLYAYLPFCLWRLLKDDGVLGIIVSNSWLGTSWGEKFQMLLNKFFHMEKLITSGKGKWFSNTDVVTTLIVLRKRDISAQLDSTEQTSFVVIEKTLQELEPTNIVDVANYIISAIPWDGHCSIQSRTQQEIMSLKALGMGMNAMFADLSWIQEINSLLVPVRSLLSFVRGERRGWNPLFYPKNNHGIESIYLKPVLKSSRNILGLLATPDTQAFCCSLSTQQLRLLGHYGTLSWIARFEHGFNKKGKPLAQVLRRAGMHWYQMQDTILADFAISVNPEKRLFVAKTQDRCFIDQRFIGLSMIDLQADALLYHALLNSMLGLFNIEALGFGRGLGALDLNSDKLENHMYMLNPKCLLAEQITQIKEAFNPLLNKNVLPLDDEFTDPLRQQFDDIVLDAFGISHLKQSIQNALFRLYQIRISVRD
ncbi:MAG: hypothetical protein DDT30_00880 [Dehalococcoidia bacterium]|nr:hypothetical protein [Bacillota bacterium]